MDVRPIHLTFFHMSKRRKYMQKHWFVLRKGHTRAKGNLLLRGAQIHLSVQHATLVLCMAAAPWLTVGIQNHLFVHPSARDKNVKFLRHAPIRR